MTGTKHKNEDGVSILLALLTIGVILTIALSVAGIVIGEIKISRGVTDSIRAIYISDAGAEKILYNTLRLKGDVTKIATTTIGGATYEASSTRSGADIKVKSSGTYRGIKRALELSHTDPSLLGYWPLDEIISGFPTTTPDLSINGNSGDLLATPTTASVPTLLTSGCQKGGCLEFNGSNYVQIANEEFFDIERTQPYTLIAWIRVDATAPNSAVIAKSVPSLLDRGYNLMYLNGGNIQGRLAYAWPFVALGRSSSGAGINNSTWHQVAVTYNGSELVSGLRIYIDGSEPAVTSTQSTGFFPGNPETVLNDAFLMIGSQDAVNSFFVGRVDEVRMYNRVLTAGEILALKNNP